MCGGVKALYFELFVRVFLKNLETMLFVKEILGMAFISYGKERYFSL